MAGSSWRTRPRRVSAVQRLLKKLTPRVLMGACAITLAAGFGAVALHVASEPNAPAMLWALAGVLALATILCVTAYAKSAPILELQQRNDRLAERLEDLEDRAWEVRESEEIHRSLSEGFGDVVFHRAPDGAMTFTNGHFDRYFSTSPLPEPAQMEPVAQGPATGEGRLRARDVEVATDLGLRWFSWAELPIRDPVSGETGLRTVARDITERKKTETRLQKALKQAGAANEAKSGFLAMISHEIRTPLNGVIGMAELLNDTPLKADQQDYVNAIQRSGQSLLGLIENLLDTAKIEQRKLDLVRVPMDIRVCVEEVADMVAPRARERGVDIATHVAADVPETIRCDVQKLRQVIVNLAGNAVKFTESGGVAIRVESAKMRGPSAKRALRISVQDTGPGLTAQEQRKIFQPFEQASTGTMRSHEGAGLGLAISQEIVKLMGSVIEVRSTPGEGAVFQFLLPLQVDDKTAIAPPVAKIEERVSVLLMPGPARAALCKTLADMGMDVDVIDPANTDLPPIEPDTLVIADQRLAAGHGAFSQPERPFRLILLGDARKVRLGKVRGDGWLTWPVREQTLAKVLRRNLDAAPLAPQMASLTDMPQEDTAPVEQVESGVRSILLAEDNPINAMLVCTMLRKLGHIVTHVENGQQAVDAVADASNLGAPFDVVLMDLHMPVLDGLNAIEAIRALEHEEGYHPTTLVVLSADGQDATRTNAEKAGADDFLLKPIDTRAIHALLGDAENPVDVRAQS